MSKFKMIHLICGAALIFGNHTVQADEQTEQTLSAVTTPLQKARSSTFAADFSINSFSGNYGLGGGISTPYFFRGAANIRLSGSYNWIQGVPKGASSETWCPYGMFKLGFFSASFVSGDSIRAYGGGGPLIVIPSSQVSSGGVQVGGFGLGGVEFFMRENWPGAMYFEVGGLGTGAEANQMENNPIYANGFLISWGFRYLL